jgi:hypothetical protein
MDFERFFGDVNVVGNTNNAYCANLESSKISTSSKLKKPVFRFGFERKLSCFEKSG